HDVIDSCPNSVFHAGDAGAFTCDVPFSDATTQEENEALAAAGKVLLASDVAVGESIVCRGTYVLTSDDVDALETVSTVSVSAADKFGKEVTDEATATTSLEQVGSVAAKAAFTYADSTSAATVGDVVDFSFTVKNAGLLTLFDINVRSVYLEVRASTISCGLDTASNPTVVGSLAGGVGGMMPYPDGGLVPGRSIECTASVEILQSEINARDLPVDVWTTAMYEGDANVLSETTSASAETHVTLGQAPVLGVEKIFSLMGESGVGGMVDFNITVKNDGNVDLVDVALTDAMFQNDGGGYDLACNDGALSTLEVGDSFSCSPQVTILQSNVDAGSMGSTARATALTTLSTPVHGSANTTVTFNREASLSCQAYCTYVDSDDTNGPSAGDMISCIFDIENNGTTTVWRMVIDSGFVGPVVCSPPLESLELAPGGKTECTSTYQANNLDAGVVTNSVVVSATSPVGDTTARIEKDVEIERESSLAVVKSGTVHAGTDGVVNAGDTVLYSFTVTNTGQTCLAVLSVLDDNAGDVNCAFVANMAGEALFCPAESVFTCTQSLTITQNDMDVGGFSGNVIVTAVSPEGESFTASEPSVVALNGSSSVGLGK
ncbi:unnamed protein product, partial [Ectocarpus sp. 8 AP-2014]